MQPNSALKTEHSSIDPFEMTTMVEVLRTRARLQSSRIAMRFLPDGSGDGVTFDYRQLDQSARAVAEALQDQDLQGERVLMFYPSGMEFISAFFGCLYAGTVAVPAYPPRKNRNLARLQDIIRDAEPRAVLTTRAIYDNLSRSLDESPELAALEWIITDEIALDYADNWQDVGIDPRALAFIQYTSGSTGSPKGVMISHGNLMANQRMMRESFLIEEHKIVVGWLPLFHDMGLIGMVMNPVYQGNQLIFTTPATFLQRPVSWLNAISRFRGTHCVVPNFSFEFCTREVTEAQQQLLDLSCWEFVLCGSEPVRQQTLDDFVARFSANGFKAECIVPSYGMAEATLLVTSSNTDQRPTYLHVDTEVLGDNKIHRVESGAEGSQVLVGNGWPPADTQLKIVDPTRLTLCEENQVGEIWLSGAHIAQGYWRNDEATRETFKATIAGHPDQYYLRTGDLGAVIDGELYITGRCKDVIIIRGRNYYPQDIEWTVESQGTDAMAHDQCIMPGSSAVFSVDKGDGEQLILVVEVTRQLYRQLTRGKGKSGAEVGAQLWRNMRRAISENHELSAHDLVLIRPGALPKTSSGKVQRRKTREMYLTGELLGEWSAIEPDQQQPSALQSVVSPVGEVSQWLRATLAKRLDMQAESIDADRSLTEYGMDSVTGMRLIAELEDYLDCSLPQDLLWEHETINALTGFLQRNETTAVPRSHEIQITADPSAILQPFPLNDIQRAYWIGRDEHIELGGVGCHFYCEFDNHDMDIERLSNAWRGLINRHSMLRTVVNNEGLQQILETVPDYRIAIDDLSRSAAFEVEKQLSNTRKQMSHECHDAGVWPLFNIRVSQLSEGQMRLHVGIDLLVTDVWSFMILLREWKNLYEHPGQTLPTIGLEFRDYLLAEQQSDDSLEMQQSLDYWRNRLADLAPAPVLPLACTPASIGVPRFCRHQGSMSVEAWSSLKDKAAQYQLTPSILLATAFAEVLGRWSRGDRFTLNMTLFNRRDIHDDVDKLVGDFTSLLLLEVDQSESGSLRERGERLQQQLRQDLKHRQVSGVQVIREQGTQGNGYPIVFTSAVGMSEKDQPGSGLDTGWLGKQAYSVSQTPQVWLDHQVIEMHGNLNYSWDVVEGLFPEGMIEDMFAAYQQLLERLAQHQGVWNQPNLDLLPEWQHQLIALANATNVSSSRQLLQQGFLQQAASRPAQIAVIDSRRELSYGLLQSLSAQLAHGLLAGGATRGQPIAVVMDKGWEQVVACLSILQASAVYVPIDPRVPADRLKHIITTTGAKLIMTQSWLRDQLNWPEDCLLVEVDRDPCSDYPDIAPVVVQSPKDLAYIIFTSGSTGVPKGVMIDHQGAVNTIQDINTRFSVGVNDRIFALSPLYFDLSVYDIFGGLAAGAMLVMPRASSMPEPSNWLQILTEHNITVWNSAPALMQIMEEYVQGESSQMGSRLRLVMLSGDRIPTQLPQKIRQTSPNARVVSLGGATEASIWSIYYPIKGGIVDANTIPYGKPLANQRFYVLDHKLAAVPVWAIGNLYIAGDGLALGYWQDEEKTTSAFISHPVTGERLYRTGDLGRYLADGNIEFLGREDFQVKIQGVRIELGEIEIALAECAGVAESVVIATQPTEAERQLIGYLVADRELDFELVKTQLKDKLPSYMIPPHFMQIDELPLTANGKLDRKKLPEFIRNKEEIVLPETDLERQISAIWQFTLGSQVIGVNDNFFEIGGYSQLAVRLIINMRDQLKLELPVRALFESPTIRQLAKRIEREYGSEYVSGDDPEIKDAAALYGHYARTAIGQRVAVIRADKQYTRAEGQYLSYRESGTQHRVLDMVCGYGSALLGHNHPLLVDTMINNLYDGLPVHAQHSNIQEAGQLGKALSDKLRQSTGRSFVATLASTGTEAVEAAIKHAKMAYKADNEAARHYMGNMDTLLLNEVQQGRIVLPDTLFASATRMLGTGPISSFAQLLKKVRHYNGLVLQREPLFIALEHAFHGMTSGALGLTASEDFRKPFQWMGVKAVRIAHEARALRSVVNAEKADLVTLELDASGAVIVGKKHHYAVAGLFMEPVQGEGGVFSLQRDFTDAAREIADEIGFPLIIDEIQCGMGRTGTFTAAEALGLRGDYYCFSKSLGGGLAKVSAMMVDRQQYQTEFGYLHGSTFAEDKLGCATALRTLEIMESMDVEGQCRTRGELFLGKLYALFEEYPDVIKDVRGSGLMLAIELHSLADSPSFLFRTLTYHGQEMLNLIIAGYLLNEKGIRIAPTKSRNAVRLLPSVLVTEAEMDQVIDAFKEVFDIIRKADAGRLLRYMVADDTELQARDWRSQHPQYQALSPLPGEPRVAHIGHVEDDETLLLADPSLASLSIDQREALLETLFPFSEVAVGQTLRIESEQGESVHLSIIGLPLTGQLFEKLTKAPETRELLIKKIDEAIDLAMAEDCTVIGFGGYTSIITMNCTAVARPGVSLTSGNAYTVALGVEGARRGAKAQGLDLPECRVAILGAKGNIGSISSRLMATEVSSLLLIGRDAADPALLEVAYTIYQDAWRTVNETVHQSLTGIAKILASLSWVEQIVSESSSVDAIGRDLYQAFNARQAENAPVQVSSAVNDLGTCDLVISATSSASPVIRPEHLSERVRVICDIATPKDVSGEVLEAWPDCLVLSGGLAKLPVTNNDQLMGTNLLEGHVFGCVAETTLLGMSRHEGHYSFGEMNRSQVESIQSLSRKYGYSLGYSKANAAVLGG